MKRFLDKARTKFETFSHDGTQEPLGPAADQHTNTLHPPTLNDITRYRFHHGANLGSVFVLERWLTGSMFDASAQGSSELAAAQDWVHREGLKHARERFERHWKTYISDADLDWLRDVGHATTVRLPIGYWTLGPAYCKHTPFEDVAAVYENAWPAVLDLVRRCWQRRIGVLIDLHGLPGGANAQDHSGTNSGKTELWTSSANKDLATRVLCFVAQKVHDLEGIAGLQIVNEAESNAAGLYDYYASVLNELARIDPTLPIYISDAWDLPRAVSWSQGHNSINAPPATNPVVIDTHLYWCFAEADQRKSPQDISSEAKAKLSELDGRDASVLDRGAAQVIVGEYSCVLNDASWNRGGGAPKESLVHDFGNAESQRFAQRAGGSFFWTYRMDWMPGGEWGFRQMTEQHAISPPRTLTFTADEVHERLARAKAHQHEARQQTCAAHCTYWNSTAPGKDFEHWRFEQGWDRGFEDAMAFFEMRSKDKEHATGADRVGLLDLWCWKRVRESGHHHSQFGWEFEQGLRQGMVDFGRSAEA